MTTRNYDAIVIGSGGGLKIALPAAKQGYRVALIEPDAFGGTCLNRGCIPSKMLIYPTEFADRIRDAGKLELHVAQPPRVDFAGLITRICKTIDAMSETIRMRCKATDNLDIYPEYAQFIGPRTLRAGDDELTGDRIFIATGSRPAIPDISGLAGTPYITSQQALRQTVLPRNPIILGGGYIAVELGNAWRAAGSQPTFIVRSRLLRREDREIADLFSTLFKRRNKVIQGFLPKAVRHDNGIFTITGQTADGGQQTVRGDALLVATGVTPNTERLALTNAGIELAADGGGIKVDDCLRTTAEGVYAMGDVICRHLFRHTVNREGEYLLKTAFAATPPAPLDYGPVPHAVFGDPEVAGVGMTEEMVREKGLSYVVGRADYADSNQGLARQLDGGRCKIIVDRVSRRLLGAHIIGDEASTMIHLLILLMKTGGTLDDLLDMIFIHPALPEIVRDAARDATEALKRIAGTGDGVAGEQIGVGEMGRGSHGLHR